MIDVNVYNYLKAESTIIAVTGQEIYNTILPAKPTFEAITFRAIEHDIDETFDGTSGFVRSDYAIDAWGNNVTEADALAKIIRDAMRDLTGTFGGITVNKISVTQAGLTVFEHTARAYRTTQMFSVWHGENET